MFQERDFGRLGSFLLWNSRTEYGILAIMGVGLFGGLELVELEYIVDKVLLASRGGTRWVGTLG